MPASQTSIRGLCLLGVMCLLLGNRGCEDVPADGTAGTAGTSGSAGAAGSATGGTTAAGSGAAGAAGKKSQAGAGAAYSAGTSAAGVSGGQSGASGAQAGAGANDDYDAGGIPQAGEGGAGSGAAGTTAAGSGGVSAPSKRCGTRGGSTCNDDQFCNFEPDVDCGGTDRGGKCESIPDVCTDSDKPVCGCNNHSYPSACNAHVAGVSVKRGTLCNPDECEQAGGHAVYSNGATIPACAAGEEGWSISGGREQVKCCVAVASTPRGRTCGGIAALQCETDEFCNYEESAGGQGCGHIIADAAGVCEAAPKGCTRDYKPVCGCDSQTYSNRCTAHTEGKSVMHEGSCTFSDCEALGGKVRSGIGTGPMCEPGETAHGSVLGDNGEIPFEGALCCLPQ